MVDLQKMKRRTNTYSINKEIREPLNSENKRL